MEKSIVAIIKTNPQTVFADIAVLAEMAGMKQALKAETATILKDNISWHLPFLSANTTPWQLEGTIRALKAAGFNDLTAVHNNTVVTDVRKGLRLNKLADVYGRYGIPDKYNFLPGDMDWEIFRPRRKMRVLHRIYPEGIKIPAFFPGKNIVHLPTAKCHIYTTITGAMKNAFGGLLATRRYHTHSCIHETLVDLLAIQKEIHPGIFSLMDATFCGNGPGPRTMIPVEKGLLLASADSVALDAVAAKIMGFDPLGIGFIRMAHEDGLGMGRMEDIEVRGEDIREMNFHFSVGNNLAGRVGRLIWYGPLQRFQRLFFHAPLLYLFIAGSYLYHDFVWWPLVGKRRMQAIVSSPWGKFFANYPADQ